MTEICTNYTYCRLSPFSHKSKDSHENSAFCHRSNLFVGEGTGNILMSMFNLIANAAARRSIVANMSVNGNPIRMVLTAHFSDNLPSGRMKGTVKWFDSTKGFGFLIPDDNGPEVFVHHTSIHANGFRSLSDGEPVEFEVMEERNGKLKALNVTGPNGDFVQGAPRRVGNSNFGYDERR